MWEQYNKEQYNKLSINCAIVGSLYKIKKYRNVYFWTRRLVSCFFLSWMAIHKDDKFKKTFVEMFADIMP